MILYVNACIREDSRTDILARHLLSKLGEYTEIKLSEENLAPLSNEMLKKRTDLIEKEDYTDAIFRYAKQFSSADTVVIAAPYWDLSFPSLLKVYFEDIYVTGIVSRYTSDGRPEGLCKAKNLYYVTTAGGPYNPDYSYGYIKELAKTCFGIENTELFAAGMLDIIGNEPEKIIADAKRKIDEHFSV